MTCRMLAVLVACSVAGCAAPPPTEIATATVKPEGCSQVAGVRGIKVVYDNNGTPIDVLPDRRRGDLEVPDARNLKAKECENVRVNIKKGNASRAGMVAFDKATGFPSPGLRPAYVARRNVVIIPIDDREGSGTYEFAYSIHVDCPEDPECEALDPMIIVER